MAWPPVARSAPSLDARSRKAPPPCAPRPRPDRPPACLPALSTTECPRRSHSWPHLDLAHVAHDPRKLLHLALQEAGELVLVALHSCLALTELLVQQVR